MQPAAVLCSFIHSFLQQMLSIYSLSARHWRCDSDQDSGHTVRIFLISASVDRQTAFRAFTLFQNESQWKECLT